MALSEEKRVLLRLSCWWMSMAEAVCRFYFCACIAILLRRRRRRRGLIEQAPSNASSGLRKRKRKRSSVDGDDLLLKGMEKIAHTLIESLKEASERLGMHIGRVEREKRMDAMKESLFVDLMKVEGLSHQERVSAYVKMISDESMLIGFYAIPQEAKTDVIRYYLCD
ncbi:uncharacterized protein LOC114741432 [Neltuma alba]|uniref:uncharacterized protein LOC114741432 n=1 Tax=Neltuma alba TaxID=207710 RepID=UPI0010A409BF|nr:uncharacterized protein LOC114741432 [Prosopis alba]